MQMVPQSDECPLGLYLAEPAEFQHFQGFCCWQWPKNKLNRNKLIGIFFV